MSNRKQRRMFPLALALAIPCSLGALECWAADYRILQSLPHDPNAFTQGLVYHDGVFYEATGLYGRSTLREVEIETGEIKRSISLGDEFFGEGITLFGDRIFQLTWREGTALVYNRSDFELLGTFPYPTQGWGLTHNGQELIMSDGSSTLRFRDPDTFEITREIDVRFNDIPLYWLNELEYVRGEILANVWKTNNIARIDPSDGRVKALVDLTGLLDGVTITRPTDILNGIAYDPGQNRLWVTGKFWPRMFQVEIFGLTDQEPAAPGDLFFLDAFSGVGFDSQVSGVLHLESSSDMSDWVLEQAIPVVQGGRYEIRDAGLSQQLIRRFFRLRVP